MIKAYIIDVRKFDDKNFLEEALRSASSFRREKYESYKLDTAKKQSIAVAYLLDKYLKTMGLCEKDMEYEISLYGKPSLKGYEDIHFCLSHSDNLAMAAFSDTDIGCDIEKVTKIDEKLIDMVLSEEEKNTLLSIENPTEKYNRFFRFWVMKEAIIKKDGLSIGEMLKKTHSDLTYINDMELLDINEKYYYALYDGVNEITNPLIYIL